MLTIRSSEVISVAFVLQFKSRAYFNKTPNVIICTRAFPYRPGRARIASSSPSDTVVTCCCSVRN